MAFFFIILELTLYRLEDILLTLLAPKKAMGVMPPAFVPESVAPDFFALIQLVAL